MIVTVTLNPAIDKSTSVERLVPEKKLRCTEMAIEAGGGGINISKAISVLGGESKAIFPCGGLNGKLLLELLPKDTIKPIPIHIKGSTRESIVIKETSTNKEYKFILPGPSLDQEELNEVKSVISNLEDTSFLICSGSLPPGVNESFFSEIAAVARKKSIKLIVDTSGPALKEALREGVYLIKPNMSELNFLAGTRYLETGEIGDAADKIMSSTTCEVMVISMGPSGALLVTRNLKKRFPAPVVKKQSTVGAGDSMLGGIVWMLAQHESLENAVQFGIACGTAATINQQTLLFERNDAYRFYDLMKSIT